MARYDASIEIDAPPEAIFPFLVEPDRLKRWVGGFVEAHGLTDGPTGPGSKSIDVIREGKREMRFETEVTAYEPPLGLSVAIKDSGMEAMSHYRLDRRGSCTRAGHVQEVRYRGFLRLMGPLVGGHGAAEAARGSGAAEGHRGECAWVAALPELVPIGRPEPRDYEVVYAIIRRGTGPLGLDLPFFARNHLAQVVGDVELLGYRVRMARVAERVGARPTDAGPLFRRRPPRASAPRWSTVAHREGDDEQRERRRVPMSSCVSPAGQHAAVVIVMRSRYDV